MNSRLLLVGCFLILYVEVQVQAAKCPVEFTKVGCFNDKHGSKRPLPNLIMTDRDKKSKVFSGTEINWKQWSEYMKDLACRCAQNTKKKNWKVFGLQFYGECWSSPSTSNVAIDGPATKDNCIADSYKTCLTSSPICVGKKNTNYVYRIVQSIAPPKPRPIKPVNPPDQGISNTECRKYTLDLVITGVNASAQMNNPISMEFLKIRSQVEIIILRVYGDYAEYITFTLLNVREVKGAVNANLLLEFAKKGKHLPLLVKDVGTKRIINAECFKPKPFCQGLCPNACAPTCTAVCCNLNYTYPPFCPPTCQTVCSAECPYQCCPQW